MDIPTLFFLLGMLILKNNYRFLKIKMEYLGDFSTYFFVCINKVGLNIRYVQF